MYFYGTATNCGSGATRYSIDVVETSVHANPACALVSPVSGRPATLAPGMVNFMRFMGPLPCFDTYALRVQMSENQQVVASIAITLDNTPTGVTIR